MGGVVKGVKHALFGSSPKIKYPDAQKLVLPRDEVLAGFYHDVFPVLLGGGYEKTDNGERLAFDPSKLTQYKEKLLDQLEKTQGLLSSVLDYSQKLLPDADYLRAVPEAPTVKTPFGEIPAYGLQRSALRNKEEYLKGLGLGQSLANQLASMSLLGLKPAEMEYQVGYLDPLNMFLKEDLARYGVHATPIGINGSGGLLGSVLAGAGKVLGAKLGGLL